MGEDFEVEMMGQEQLRQKREQVQREVDATVGWGCPNTSYGEDDSGATILSPKQFFHRTVQAFAHATNEEDVKRTSWPGNMWVTGNTTFSKLVVRHLRWYGALRDEIVVEKNGMELRSGDPAALLKTWFAEADGGCLFIDEAYSMLSGEDGARDDSGRAAVAALLTESANKGVLVILAGYKEDMRGFMSSNSGLPGRFLRHVHCEDYHASELAMMVKLGIEEHGYSYSQTAADEPTMEELVENHIQSVHLDTQNDKSNGRLAGNLAASAIIKCQTRLEKARIAAEKDGGSGDGSEDDAADHTMLLPGDFGIGVAIGGGELARAAVAQEIDDLIGMDVAKEWFKKFQSKVEYVEKTGDRSALKTCLNLVITGNPGTGKTTFTRLVFRVLYAYGILSRNNFVEKNGLELKGRYVGETAPKVQKAVNEAMGGCLFLDEAYALANDANGDCPFAKEAVRTLLTSIENNRTNLMVVFAGYKDKIGNLMRLDPGLDRRFPERLHLDDYTASELADIAEYVAKCRFNKTLAAGVKDQLEHHIQNYYKKEIAEQNGGLSVNLCEKAIDRQLRRIVASPGFSDLDPEEAKLRALELTAADFDVEDKRKLGNEEMKAELDAEVDALIGMDNVKLYLRELADVVTFVEKGGDPAVLNTNLNLILTGNPGTGKTTVARLIARFLYVHGMLPKSNFVEKNGLELKGRFVGQTSGTVKEAVANAMGGCLFLDEAYALAQSQDSFSGEAIRTLLTEVENNRTNLLVVLAGYREPMDDLLRMDPGLPRRFATTLYLEDYSPAELSRICEQAAFDRFKLKFAPGLLIALETEFQSTYAHMVASENAGLSVNLVEKAARRLASRAAKGSVGKSFALNLDTLEASDFGIGETTALIVGSPKVPAAAAAAGEGGGSSCCGGSHTHNHGGNCVVPPAVEYAYDYEDEIVDKVEEIESEDEAPEEVVTIVEDIAEVAASDGEEDADDDVTDDEEIGEETIMERLATRGKCPQQFEWNEHNHKNGTCGLCQKTFWQGYRCNGGGHYVCFACIR